MRLSILSFYLELARYKALEFWILSTGRRERLRHPDSIEVLSFYALFPRGAIYVFRNRNPASFAVAVVTPRASYHSDNMTTIQLRSVLGALSR